MKVIKLNPAEARLLRALHLEAGSNGHDFGLVECVPTKLGRQALGAYLTTFQTKGLIEVHEPVFTDRWYTQYTWCAAAVPVLRQLGLGTPPNLLDSAGYEEPLSAGAARPRS